MGWAGSRSSGGLIRGQVVVNGLEMMETQWFSSKAGWVVIRKQEGWEQ